MEVISPNTGPAILVEGVPAAEPWLRAELPLLSSEQRLANCQVRESCVTSTSCSARPSACFLPNP
jgi:hypothetical protein